MYEKQGLQNLESSLEATVLKKDKPTGTFRKLWSDDKRGLRGLENTVFEDGKTRTKELGKESESIKQGLADFTLMKRSLRDLSMI